MKFRNFFLLIFFKITASLPFSILYGLSNSFVAQYIIRYRKEIVYQNLRNSFPDEGEKGIKKIASKFYHNLSDLVVEVIKSHKMTRQQLDERVSFKNQEVLKNELFVGSKNVFASLGHCGNWEWVGNKIATFLKHEGGAIYKPVHDKFFDDYMISQRQKYKGTLMIVYKKVFRTAF